jgi:hypothetical protein
LRVRPSTTGLATGSSVKASGPKFQPRVWALGLRLPLAKLTSAIPIRCSVVQPVAAVIFVGEVGEGARPQEAGVLELVAGPGGGAQVLGRLLARNVAHLLDADDAGQVVAAGLDLGRRGQDGDAARGAGRLVARGRQAVERGVDQAEHAAQQALAREQLGGEVADMAGLDVLGIQIDGGQPLAHASLEGVGQLAALAAPVGGEVALPAAQHIDHARTPFLVSPTIQATYASPRR